MISYKIMDNEKFGNFIKELRKEKNLTQKQLADKINITDKAISKWERGLSFPDITMLNILSKELNVSVEELLNGEKFKEKVINNKEDDNLKLNNSEKHIDIEKAVKEALEKANHKQEKRNQKIAKVKKVTKIVSAILFIIFLALQIIYFYLFFNYGFEYIVDSFFYIVNEIIFTTLFLFLLFSFRKKKIKLALIIIFFIITLVNIAFMGIYGFRNKSYVRFSNNLKYEFVAKQNRETNELSIYKNAVVIFARPMQTLSETVNDAKIRWISRDIFEITYKNNENLLKEYVVTLNEDTFNLEYRSFTKSLLGKWQNKEQTNKLTRLYVDSKNIRLKTYDKEYTFELEECVQVREEAIILYSNKKPRYIVALSNDAELDEETGIIKKGGNVIISEISTNKTIKEELYCINYKTDDLTNYNYVDLASKTYKIENGVLYFSYDGIKTITVPGDFTNIESYEKDQYVISEDIILFYYKINGKTYIVTSNDKGVNWNTEQIPSGNYIKSIQFLNENTGFILMFNDETMGDATGAIFKTTNSGRSWEEVFKGINYGDYSIFSSGTEMIFANENVVFITMPDRMGEVCDLFITRDGGYTFEKLNLATDPKLDYYLLPTIENGIINIKITIGYAEDDSRYITVENFVSKNNGETFEKVL